MKHALITAAIVLVVAGCGTAGAQTGSAAPKGGESAATLPVRSPAASPLWIDSLQMISATSGWALISTSNPNSSTGLDVARTSDGARTWYIASPSGTRAELAEGAVLLSADSAQRAWVVGTSGQSSVVFSTVDGGRTWSTSKLIPGDDPVAVAFAGQNQGLLLESMGAAMSQNPVRLYRSSDDGQSWALVARTAQVPGERPNTSGLPVACDKTGVAASPGSVAGTAGVWWITAFCPTLLADAVLVSRDGGAHWASPPLPIPPSACQQSGCEVTEPQFAGRTSFLVLWAYPDQALLLATTDGGASWKTVIMPAGAGAYPRVRFFSPADGIAVSAGP